MKKIRSFISSLLTNMNERRFLYLFFAIGITVGIVVIHVNGPYVMPPDGTGFHKYAVNIAEHGVYSPSSVAPYIVDLVREPGYPVFLAAVYKLYSIWNKPTTITKEQYSSESRKLRVRKGEIEFAKHIQLILLLVAAFLFYLVIKMYSSISLSRIVALTTILYYPYMMFSTRIMRESLVAFLLALFTYTLAQYYKSHKSWYLVMATLVIGFASLTWQVMIVFTPMILIVMLLARVSVIKSLVRSCLYAVLFLATVAPWLMYAYNFYPDIRIVKSMGTSLTPEIMYYVSSRMEAQYQGLMTAEEVSKDFLEDVSLLSTSERFNRSFSGWYKNSADSLLQHKNYSRKDHYKYLAVNVVTRLKKMVIQNTWSPFNTKFKSSVFLKRSKWGNAELINGMCFEIQSMFLHLVSIGIGILSVLGILVIPKRKLIFLSPYVLYCLMFYIIGSESRRFVPIIPFMIYLTIYALAYTKRRIVSLAALVYLRDMAGLHKIYTID